MALKRIRIPVFDLGVAPYAPVQTLQRHLQEAVVERRIPGVLLLLEHEPVITLGTRGTDDDLRLPSGVAPPHIPIERSERGGLATLHAPGQLVTYPVVRVPGRDLRGYVRRLEETLITLLDGYGVKASRREKRPGVHVGDMKIASVGLRCRRWVAAHGTALNVSVDLSLFDLIVSCGEPELLQTSLEALTGRSHPMSEVKERYVSAAAGVFGWRLDPPITLTHDEVLPTLGL